jgi:hypothetical protein
MTRPLWPLALALWLGTGPAITKPVAPGGSDRAVAPGAPAQDANARAARAAPGTPRQARPAARRDEANPRAPGA